MSANKNNNIFEKTSFLGNNSSEFVETLYSDYLNDPDKLPEQWRNFFEGLNEEREKILKNVNGPSWSRKKKIKSTIADGYKGLDKKNGDLQDSVSEGNVLEAAKDSVRANMLVRAYRIRGHLISNLDPLGLLKREEHSELKPETYGFSNKDLNKKIFLDGTLGIQTASLKEILSILKNTYCRNIGFEFMHMSDPEERRWIRDRIEGKKGKLNLQKMERKRYLINWLKPKDLKNFYMLNL